MFTEGDARGYKVQTSCNIRRTNFIIGLVLLITVAASGWVVVANQVVESGHKNKVATAVFTRHDSTYSVSALGDGSLIAVGMFGRIFRASGKSLVWEEISSPTTEDLYSVAFPDDRNGIVVGANGTYLETADGGHTWNNRDMTSISDSVHDHHLMTVVLNQNGEGLIAGTFGLLWRTDSGGNTWEPVTIPWEKVLADVWKNYGSVEPHLYGAVIKGAEAWVVGEYGLVLRSTDGGRNFEKRRGGQFTDSHLFSVEADLTNFNRAVAVGQAGLIISTSDGGETWEDSSRWETDLYDVLLHKNGAVISGDLGSVLHLSDSGEPNKYTVVAAAGWKDVVMLGDGWIIDILHLGQDRFLALGKYSFRTFTLPSQHVSKADLMPGG